MLELALGLLAGSQAACPVWQDQGTPVQEFQQVDAATKARYYLYVPSNYDPEQRWPMVVTLHGTPGFDSAKAQARSWKALAERHGFLVLAPSLSSPQGILPVSRSARLGKLETDERNVLASMAAVKESYPFDESAVLLTGFSAGGYPLYYIALRNPHLFDAAVACMCNCDVELLGSLPITDNVRKTPMLIFFSKSGNPLYSKWNPIAQQSWAAYRHLRENGCFKVCIDAVKGGHSRRPEVAYRFWKKCLGKSR
jgi:predicted peptidase